ncbi:hypothetical protein YC2023_035833 [Brassica napus]
MAITSEIDQKNAKDPSIAKANIITAPLQRIMHQTGIELGNLQDNSPRDDISSWNCKQKSIPMDIPFNIAHGSKDASFVRVVSVSHQAMTSEVIRRTRWTQPSAKPISSQLLYDKSTPAGNRTQVCTVARYFSTTRPLVL